MKDRTGDNKIIRALEIRVFGYALIFGLAIRASRSIQEFMTDAPNAVQLLGLCNLMLIAYLLYSYRARPNTAVIIFYSQILLTSILTWEISGEWQGTVPYLMIALVVAIVMTCNKPIQYFLLPAYGITLFIFSQISPVEIPSLEENPYFVISIHINFFIVTITLVLFTFYLKTRFINYRKYIELTNVRLINATEVVAKQLAQQQTLNIELSAIQNNLEELVEAKVKEARQMSGVLREYAFVNAHHVRAPLARILGLITLLDKHGMDADTADVVHSIQGEALEIDQIIKKIDQVTS